MTRKPTRPPLPLPPKVERRKRRQLRLRWWRRTFFLFAEGGLALFFIAYLAVQWTASQEPFPHAWFTPSTLSLRILDRDGQPIHEVPAQNGLFGAWLPDSHIPFAIKRMTIAAEDHRLMEHPGVDIWAVGRALWDNLSPTRRRSGASTLAMQLVRRLQPAPRTYSNKIREMYWALVLQHHLGPHGILREYLNRAPYGNRVQGVQRAALLYFDRPAADLSFAQAAFLAALPWGPSYLNPFHASGYKRAIARTRWILRKARSLGILTKVQFREAMADPLEIQPRPQRAKEAIHLTQRIEHFWRTQYPFLSKNKKAATKSIYPLHSGSTQHKRVAEVTTSLDLGLQKALVQSLQKRLRTLPYATGEGSGAVVVLDLRNNEVLAYVGSPNYFSQKSRGAIDYAQTPRAPGSTLKPFVYAQAIQSLGFTGATLFQDMATTFLWKQGTYQPQNHDTRFLGPVRLRVALGNSRNIPVLHAISKVGIEPTLDLLRSLGMFHLKQNANEVGLGLALGNTEVPLIELVRAYAILARGGVDVPLQWAIKARDSLGNTIDPKQLQPDLLTQPLTSTPMLRQETTQIIANILADPVARLPSFGRNGLLEFDFPVAIKTGTSQGHRDAWMLAFSEHFLVGCWIGYHDRRRMDGVYGTKGCGPIIRDAFKETMKRFRTKQPPSDFSPPEGWTKRHICPLSGQPVGPQCPGKVEEWFPPNHRHFYETCPFHRKINLDRRNGLRASLQCPANQLEQRSFVVLPPLFATWAKAMGFPQAPEDFSPLCSPSNQEKSFTLTISQPLHRASFVMDPTIPSEFATIALQVESTKKLKHVSWYANGQKIGQADWPYTMRWKLQPGQHEFVAVDPHNRIRSQTVTIVVH